MLKVSSEQAQQVLKDLSARNIDDLVRTQSLSSDVEKSKYIIGTRDYWLE